MNVFSSCQLKLSVATNSYSTYGLLLLLLAKLLDKYKLAQKGEAKRVEAQLDWPKQSSIAQYDLSAQIYYNQVTETDSLASLLSRLNLDLDRPNLPQLVSFIGLSFSHFHFHFQFQFLF